MPQTQDSPNSRDDIGTTIILQQLDQLNKRLDTGFDRATVNLDKLAVEMRQNMKAYVLDEVHKMDIKRLDDKDKEQQDALERLEDRVISAPQRYVLTVCSIIGGVGGIAGLLHLFHIL